MDQKSEGCPGWISLFLLDVIIPGLMVMGVALLILRKNGSDLNREIWNITLPQKRSNPSKKIIQGSEIEIRDTVSYNSNDLIHQKINPGSKILQNHPKSQAMMAETSM